jgi:glyoxylase-like metal-dependent hydrolase (beta-lactamase superfamily II)
VEIGDYRLEIIPDTEFRLDGGAMFGVVPRVLWERVSPPDELNRVRLNMNCVFIDTGKDKILIETGIGEKWSQKETAMYGIFRERPFAETLFENAGCSPDDITIVVNTHLHFDHAGGNTIADRGSRIADSDTGRHPTGREGASSNAERGMRNAEFDTGGNPTGREGASHPHSPIVNPQFHNARYFISKSEYEHASEPHERDQASYLPENWRPVAESGQLELKPDDYEVIPGLHMRTIPGHSRTMQTWRLDHGGRTVYGFADLIPTRNHLSLPWIMGYDLFPTETLEFKKRVVPQAIAESWLCLFYHDVDSPLRTIREIDGKITSEECEL